VRYLNYRFTILGEANAPGNYTTFNTRLSLFEALGMAGDLTYYANRERITVIREQNGSRTYALLNLQDKEIIHSPYFYLKQNDVIYIEPMPARITSVSDPIFRWVGLFTTGISLLTLVLTLTSL
jgi:polysaccharide export outer membrane protein